MTPGWLRFPGRERLKFGSGARRCTGLLGVLAFAALASSCTESLESTAGCPILCPNQSPEAKEVVLEDGIELDLTVGGFPTLGDAGFFTLATSGDTLDNRVVIRFDSIPNKWTLGGNDSLISAVDSSHLRIFVDTAASDLRDDVTFDIYDVDTTAADANSGALVPLFRADRLIGTISFTPTALRDTIDIPISNALLLSKITSSQRLRVGIRIRSDSTARVVMYTANQGLFPRLRYDPAPNNVDINIFERVPRSWTPADDIRLAIDFTDFTIPVSGMFPLRKFTAGIDTSGVFSDSVLAVGGISGRRVYLKFKVPDSVLSASIVRATLILHKKPSSDFAVPRDTISVVPQVVFATANVPPSKAAVLTDTVRLFPLLSQRLVPRNSGEVRFDLANYARTWSTDTTARIPFAIILRAGLEDRTIQEILFYSTTGPAALRPRLRLTYVPRQVIGLP